MVSMFSNSSTQSGADVSKPGDHPATILVVEDSKDTRNVLDFALTDYGYKVVTAVNGEEALGVALRERPDLILMDLNMPLMDGLAATEQIREQEELQKVPILAVTAYDTYGMKEAAEEAGCDGYIKKPIDFGRLDTILRRILSC
jgi:two-component system, cell cycle response regulator DivK